MKGFNAEKFLKVLYELTAREHGVRISVTITDKKGRLAATEGSNSGQKEEAK